MGKGSWGLPENARGSNYYGNIEIKRESLTLSTIKHEVSKIKKLFDERLILLDDLNDSLNKLEQYKKRMAQYKSSNNSAHSSFFNSPYSAAEIDDVEVEVSNALRLIQTIKQNSENAILNRQINHSNDCSVNSGNFKFPSAISRDILCELFSHLPYKDRLAMRATCKKWQTLIDAMPIQEPYLRLETSHKKKVIFNNAMECKNASLGQVIMKL